MIAVSGKITVSKTALNVTMISYTSSPMKYGTSSGVCGEQELLALDWLKYHSPNMTNPVLNTLVIVQSIVILNLALAGVSSAVYLMAFFTRIYLDGFKLNRLRTLEYYCNHSIRLYNWWLKGVIA